MAQSSSDGVAIRQVRTSGFVDDVMFSCHGQMDQNQALYVSKKFARWRYQFQTSDNYRVGSSSSECGDEVCYLRLTCCVCSYRAFGAQVGTSTDPSNTSNGTSHSPPPPPWYHLHEWLLQSSSSQSYTMDRTLLLSRIAGMLGSTTLQRSIGHITGKHDVIHRTGNRPTWCRLQRCRQMRPARQSCHVSVERCWHGNYFEYV